jgi:hypothetical protein
LTIAIPTAKLEQMIKVGGTWAMTETPQFSSFSTQPFDALAQQQPSQGQITSETEFVDRIRASARRKPRDFSPSD